MLPILLKIGPLKLYTYGLCVALGFLAALKLLLIQARKEKVKDDFVYDLIFYIFIAVILGSRIFYVLVNWGNYASHPLSIFFFWEGGLFFHGGLIGGIVATIIFTRANKFSLNKIGDWTAPAIAWDRQSGESVVLLSVVVTATRPIYPGGYLLTIP